MAGTVSQLMEQGGVVFLNLAEGFHLGHLDSIQAGRVAGLITYMLNLWLVLESLDNGLTRFDRCVVMCLNVRFVNCLELFLVNTFGLLNVYNLVSTAEGELALSPLLRSRPSPSAKTQWA